MAASFQLAATGRKNRTEGAGAAPPVLVGVATPNPAEMGRPLFNSAALLNKGSGGPTFHKTLLPTYDVFDEDRYFEPCREPQVLEFDGRHI